MRCPRPPCCERVYRAARCISRRDSHSICRGGCRLSARLWSLPVTLVCAFALSASAAHAEALFAVSLAPECNAPPPGQFAGAPPPFTKPVAGSAEIVSLPGGEAACVLRHMDGSLFARALSVNGAVYQVEYYDSLGNLSFRFVGEFPQGAAEGEEGVEHTEDSYYCETAGNEPQNARWLLSDMPIVWQLGYGSIPDDVDASTTEQNFRNAHIQWSSNTNRCDISDSSWLDFSYGGHTTRGVGKNGYNTVGFGPVEDICGATYIACELTWFYACSRAYSCVDESDVRMDNTGTAWQNGSSREGRYDIWHVYAHELGHTVQFAHTTDTRQVMYRGHSPRHTWKRKLSKGDALGNNAKY